MKGSYFTGQASRDIDLKDGTPIRRYLSFAKFGDLLRSKTIFLNRADRFQDRFEGALIPGFRKALDAAVVADHFIDDAETFYDRCRRGNFVNSWVFGSKDNMGMWQVFGGVEQSVSITSTIDRLTRTCCLWGENVFISKIGYINHFENPDMIIGHYFDPLRYKHEAFDFEREVRIIVSRQDDWKNNPEYIRLPINDLSDLITNVIVAPYAEPWFISLVEDICQKYGLAAPVKMSPLAAPPT